MEVEEHYCDTIFIIVITISAVIFEPGLDQAFFI